MMEKRKMLRLCDKMTESNVAWEKEKHGMEDDPLRREVVQSWMWAALVHLHALGYDVVKQTKKPNDA